MKELKRKRLESSRPITTAATLTLPWIGTAAPTIAICITTVDFRVVSILSYFAISTFGEQGKRDCTGRRRLSTYTVRRQPSNSDNLCLRMYLVSIASLHAFDIAHSSSSPSPSHSRNSWRGGRKKCRVTQLHPRSSKRRCCSCWLWI